MIIKKIRNWKAKRRLLKLQNIKVKYSNKNQFNNLLFCPLNGAAINTLRETIMALSCKIRGAQVSMLYLDSNMPISEFYNSRLTKLVNLIKVKSNIRFLNRLGIKTLQTSDYTSTKQKYININADSIEKLEYEGILIGDLVVASTVRTFLSHGPEWNNPEFTQTITKVLESAQVLVSQYNKILDKLKPDKIVMSHGIYVSWGILFRLARKRGIAVDVYGSSYRKNTLRFYHNTPNAPIPTGEWNKFKSIRLNNSENKNLDTYISSRETQKDDNISLFDQEEKIPKHILEFVEKYKQKKIFCLFTNIAWDAFAFSEEGKFESMNEWIKETVNYFNIHHDIALIIKAHPAEIYHKTPIKYRVRTFINTLQLKENILVINEGEGIKPFWLYKQIHVGLIHISTVGIEMALQNIPVLTSGAKGHYSDKGFTIDPKSKDDYFNKLSELKTNKLDFVPDINLARRYMYFRFFREAIDFNVMTTDNASTIHSIKINSIKDLYKGNNENIDIICKGILNDERFINN